MQGGDEGEPIRRLFYGDCLTFMRKHLPRASVDMIYVDPPFKPGRYNAIYKEETGRPLPQQVESPFDVWQLPEHRERAHRTLTVTTQRTALVDDSVEFARLWTNNIWSGQPRMLAYLTGMVERLQWMKAVLRPTGSIFLHCDPATLHYVKVLMDAVFGHPNFRREIRRNRARRDDCATPAAPVPETILLYRASAAQGTTDLPPTGMDDPSKADDYPRQRPAALLEHLISTSTKPGAVIFDPFCGSGSAIEAAERLGRQWIAVDAAYHTVRRTAKHCLQQRLGFEEDIDLLIDAMPVDLCSAKALCDSDPAQFERWAVEQVGGFVTTSESTRGKVVGRIHFALPGTTRLESMVVLACSGPAEEADFRELRAFLDQGDALLAGLIIMEPLEPDMCAVVRRVATGLGDVTLSKTSFARMQVLDLRQVFDRQGFDTPRGTSTQLQIDV